VQRRGTNAARGLRDLLDRPDALARDPISPKDTEHESKAEDEPHAPPIRDKELFLIGAIQGDLNHAAVITTRADRRPGSESPEGSACLRVDLGSLSWFRVNRNWTGKDVRHELLSHARRLNDRLSALIEDAYIDSLVLTCGPFPFYLLPDLDGVFRSVP
jgi:hypothetical protein